MIPTKGDVAVVGVGAATPFIAGANGGDLPSLINMAIAAAASAAAAAMIKAAVSGGGAFIRAKVRRMRTDDDPKNDDTAEALEAVADKLDPEGAKKNPLSPSTEITTKIERGPKP